MLFPAFAPAARAGLRLPLRDVGRASGRASLRGALSFRERLLLRPLELGLLVDLAPFEWPFRWPQAGAADFALRAPELPLDGRAALPLDRAPLPLERVALGRAALLAPLLPCPLPACPFPLWPLPAWVPLCFALALAGAVGLQRVLEAGREPVAGRAPEGRAAAVRVSALGRRTGRLVRWLLADDWAGLRSREGVAGRLK